MEQRYSVALLTPKYAHTVSIASILPGQYALLPCNMHVAAVVLIFDPPKLSWQALNASTVHNQRACPTICCSSV